MKTITFVFLALLVLAQTSARGDITLAQKFYEEGLYDQALATLATVDQANGRTPRAESIRLLSLDALGRTRDAYLSALAYTELTRSMDLADNEAHQNLVALRDDLRRRLAGERDAKRAVLMKEQAGATQAAERVLGALHEAAVAREEAATAAQAAKIEAAVPPTLPETILVERVPVIKDAPRTPDRRGPSLADIDTGPFKLGMSKAEFEAILMARMRAYETRDPAVMALIKDYRAEYHASSQSDVYNFKIFLGGEPHETFGTVSSLDAYSWKRGGYSRHPDERFVALSHLDDALSRSGESDIADLAPEALVCKVVKVTFDESDRLDSLLIAAVFPEDFRDHELIARRIIHRFGRPDTDSTFSRSTPGTYRGDGLSLGYGLSDRSGGALHIRIVDNYSYDGTRDLPLIMHFTITAPLPKGHLGVEMAAAEPKVLRPMKLSHGVVVTRVTGRPAAEAGLRFGDIIVSFDGKPAVDVATANRVIAGAGPRKSTTMEVLRDGRPETLTVTTGLAPAGSSTLPARPVGGSARFSVQALTPVTRRFGKHDGDFGVFLNSGRYQPNELNPGMYGAGVIVSYGGRRVSSIREFQDLVRASSPGSFVYIGMFNRAKPRTSLFIVPATIDFKIVE